MHVEKYQKSAVGHMLRHYARISMSFGNESIDHLKSDNNYNLAPRRHIDDFAYYKQRLSQVKCQNRSDVKTLCDWIVTLPKQTFTEEQERQFFKASYAFMAKRYDEKNIVSAWVHKDEAGQPHMHFAFIPICIDKKKGIEKVSAKEVITRNDLRVIHREMAEYMERIFARDVGILNGSTAGGNKTITELKTRELEDELATLSNLKTQSIAELTETIKKRPKVLDNITEAARIAAGETPTHQQIHERAHERTR